MLRQLCDSSVYKTPYFGMFSEVRRFILLK
jgi:hypothetical protein